MTTRELTTRRLIIRRLVTVTGIVQGVGFRPFVFQHACALNLTGWVCNSTGGVSIELQGETQAIDEFVDRLQTQAPPLSRIDGLQQSEQTVIANCHQFEIRQSRDEGPIHIDVSPDKKTCDACREDILNPQSRFYHYPFTNCTHCGPRYSIIKKLPYDRAFTSMNEFAMCSACEQDYRDPMNRRYHAQPISCPDCGPQLTFFCKQNSSTAHKQAAMQQAVKVIAAGGVIAVKGLGGFHLVCDATQPSAVTRLRQLKMRERKPFALMVANVEQAQQLVTGNELEWQTLESADAPIILMKKRRDAQGLASNVAHHNPYLGVMLPYTPLHLLLFEQLHNIGATQALVMTSANRSGIPLATELAQVWSQFPQHLDGVLDHNRPIVQACDDSLVQVVAGKVRVLRLARGYAPLSFALPNSVEPTIAVGAQQKSVFAVADQQHWLLSPYIGELDDLDTQQRFTQTVDWFQQLYHCQAPQWVADLHPDYFSHQFAQTSARTDAKDKCQTVQHHYAHILSVMAEHQLTQQVLGIALDGTGLGDDDTVWGGEVMLADAQQYQRVAHVRPFRLIGRHKAIQEPARILYALLLEAYRPHEIQAMQLSAFNTWSDAQFANLYQLWQNPTHSPLCSSTGRLFDAWAVLLGLLTQLDYEGESGLLIEAGALAASGGDFSLDLNWKSIDSGAQQLDWLPALQQSIQYISQSNSSAERVDQVCDAFCLAWAKAVLSIAKSFTQHDVALSGGVCQNRVLMNYVQQLAPQYLADRQLYLNEKIPSNDAGIAAGQIWHSIHQV